jgi:hypothetical protein
LTHYQALDQLRSWEDLFNKTGHRRSRSEHGALRRAFSAGNATVRRTRRSSKARTSTKRRTLSRHSPNQT